MTLRKREITSGNTRSHSLGNSLWQRLWTYSKTTTTTAAAAAAAVVVVVVVVVAVLGCEIFYI
jgi:hypothetical protein